MFEIKEQSVEQSFEFSREKIQAEQSMTLRSLLKSPANQPDSPCDERPRTPSKMVACEKTIRHDNFSPTSSPNILSEADIIRIKNEQRLEEEQKKIEQAKRELEDDLAKLREQKEQVLAKLKQKKEQEEQEYKEMLAKLQAKKDWDSQQIETEKLERMRQKEIEEQKKMEQQMPKMKKKLVQQQAPEEIKDQVSFSQSDQDFMGFNEHELDNQCQDLFKTAPIPFKPRRGVELDEAIAQLIADYNITIPIQYIKGSLYLVGTNRCNLALRRQYVLVRIGGGFHKLYEYLPQNNQMFQRQLVILMIKTGQSLEQIV